METTIIQKKNNKIMGGNVNDSASLSTDDLEQLINQHFSGGSANYSESMSTSKLEQLIDTNLQGGAAAPTNNLRKKNNNATLDSTSMSTSQLEKLISKQLSGGSKATSNTYSEINSTDVNIEQFMINNNNATSSFNTDEINIINNATTSEIFPNNLKRTN